MIDRPILLIFKAFILMRVFPKSEKATFFVTMKLRFSENFECGLFDREGEIVET